VAGFEETALPRSNSTGLARDRVHVHSNDGDFEAMPAAVTHMQVYRIAHAVRRYMSLLLIAGVPLACARDFGPTVPPPPPPSPVADVRLTDVVIPLLPSPYYRFEYDPTGRLTFASFASDLRTYDIHYEGNRMSEMQSTGSSRDRLAYFYDRDGKVSLVTYSDGAGTVYVRVYLTYTAERLVTLERERRVEGGFQFDKRMSFVYDADGNLAELTDQRLPFPGQTEATFVDRFEQYDAGINVDGFDLLHSEFFDHLVLLPGVRLQLGNPAAVTRSGSGTNYHVDYAYTYDGENRPLTKHGDVTILNGTSAGQRFETNSTFSYQ
jgi:hypothetical protein